MTSGSVELGRFEVVKLAALRTAQLMRGCLPRVVRSGKLTTTALREVADGKVWSVTSTSAGEHAPTTGDGRETTTVI
jgi:DNA-directed RNA polymerase subunit K/omega